MSTTILERLGRVRALEGALELGAPLTLATLAWWAGVRWLSAPTVAAGFTALELGALLGAAGALTGWAVGRLLFVARRRRPDVMVGVSVGLVGLLLLALPGWARSGFLEACAEVVKGEAVALAPLDPTRSLAPGEDASTAERVVCRTGGVPDNAYLPGTLRRPSWSGQLTFLQGGVALALAGLGALGSRHRRLLPSRAAALVLRELPLAAAAGSSSAIGRARSKDGRVVACDNLTLWGESCGQIFPADRVFLPGEPCPRCRQTFTPCARLLSLDVVSLFNADVDVLNGIERMDAVAWPAGSTMHSEAGLSGVARWVVLGSLQVPDVLTVAQALALAHERLAAWCAHEDPRIREAAELARRRASRVSAWIWSGPGLGSRLHRARPDQGARLAVGSARLRDLTPGASSSLWLQLDIGLLPLEIRMGWRQPGASEDTNHKVDLWIPVGPSSAPRGQGGLWVPRIEGDGLRAWLSLARLDERAASVRAQPVPYRGRRPSAPPRAEGRLDFQRQPLGVDDNEPAPSGEPGTSISEWRWMEGEQIELLRQQTLVLVEEEA